MPAPGARPPGRQFADSSGVRSRADVPLTWSLAELDQRQPFVLEVAHDLAASMNLKSVVLPSVAISRPWSRQSV
jgi:hypothetical protein